jgi:hypothetical protein
MAGPASSDARAMLGYRRGPRAEEWTILVRPAREDADGGRSCEHVETPRNDRRNAIADDTSRDAQSDQSDETTMHVGTMPGGDTTAHVSCCHARRIAKLEARG